ncbi:peptidoglycan binding protein CsiV [Gammaproteobacteria bacterium]|nr:peptidoglycan binding protein CsiV [Gammaproteobacteria bacterium]
MNSFNLHLIFFIFTLSSLTQAEINKEYIIEVIMFEQLEIIGDEILKPQILDISNINSVTLLDKPQIRINEEKISQSFNQAGTILILDQAFKEKIIDTQNETLDEKKPLKKINEKIWFEKQVNLNQLDNIYRRLDRRQEYKILHKQSWRQPALEKESAPFVHEIFENNGFLIKLYKSRYLHLEVMAYIDGDLKSALNEDLIKEIKFEALQSSIPKDITNHSIEIDKELINLPQIFIPNFEMLKNSTTSSQIIEVGEVKYLLSEQRRIFKNESHYFDHPKIGVIISVYDSSL